MSQSPPPTQQPRQQAASQRPQLTDEQRFQSMPHVQSQLLTQIRDGLVKTDFKLFLLTTVVVGYIGLSLIGQVVLCILVLGQR